MEAALNRILLGFAAALITFGLIRSSHWKKPIEVDEEIRKNNLEPQRQWQEIEKLKTETKQR